MNFKKWLPRCLKKGEEREGLDPYAGWLIDVLNKIGTLESLYFNRGYYRGSQKPSASFDILSLKPLEREGLIRIKTSRLWRKLCRRGERSKAWMLAASEGVVVAPRNTRYYEKNPMAVKLTEKGKKVYEQIRCYLEILQKPVPNTDLSGRRLLSPPWIEFPEKNNL